jgi:hypothetical protein
MDLDGAWEIRLAEIQYPHSWYNIKNNEAWLKVHLYKESQLQKHLVLLPDGYNSSVKRIINAIEGKRHRTELKSSSVRIQTSYIPGGRVCFRLGSGCQERIKLSVRLLSLGGTENGGRCPGTVIENRTGGRKRRRNDHPSV